MENNKIKKCRVCGDQSSVFYNYNGLSCKSCKKFFLRCVTKVKHYVCVDEDNCPIDKYTRKQCQKCRLKKCFDIGMKKELAIYNKNNNSVKCTTISKQIIEPKVCTSELNWYEMSLITQIRTASEKLDFAQNAQIAGRITTLIEAINFNEYFARRFVKFCKNIPAFKELKSADQLILLKEAYPEICNISTGFYIDYDKKRMPIVGNESGDQIYYLDCPSISSGLSHSQVWSNYDRFTKSMKIKMDNDSMIKNLIIVQLLFKTRPNISSPEFVHYNHLLYKHLLKRYLEHKYKDKTARYANTIYESIQKLLDCQIDCSTVFVKRMMQIEITDIKLVNEILKEILGLI